MVSAAEADAALVRADDALRRFDVDGLMAHLATALRAYTSSGDVRAAAMVCVRMGDVLANMLGNTVAGRVWFVRAARLLADEPPCIEQGWVAVAAMGCDVGDPAELLACAELALDRARRFGDVNLETKALADGGLAHVQAGRLAEGFAMLDEAMALACGAADDEDTSAKSVCSFFTACYYAAEFERASTWAELLRGRGLIGDAPVGPIFLSNHCDMVQATLLGEMGRWGEAEAVLTRAMASFEAVMPATSWHPSIGLAELRIRQGRLTDAEALLAGHDQAFEALLPIARLWAARGDADLARSAIRRGLRALGQDRLRATELLTTLVDVELAAGDLAAADVAVRQLEDRVADVSVVSLRVRASVQRARVLHAAGETGAAIAVLEAATTDIDPRRLPWLCALVHLELANLRDTHGDLRGAQADAATAARGLAALDVVVTPDQADVLRRLVPAGGSSPPGIRPVELRRDGTWWEVHDGDLRVRLRHTKGLAYLAELVTWPGVERHAFDLVDRVEGVDPEGPDRRTLGDAGEVADSRARAEYRRRIEVLRSECDDALAGGDLDVAEARQEELDALVAQLAAAFGLGGRDRHAASAAERARLNVTRALRAAIAKLTEAVPDVGAHLDRRVRTGLYCAYEPDETDDVRWIVQP